VERSEQVTQIKLLMARLDSGVNVDAGGFRRNPASVYVDPALAGMEWTAFFAGHPHLIGLSGDLPRPGTFLTCDDLATPILATRDDDGTFRAFVNACRHRGMIVENQERGEAGRFTCPFHRWTYDLGGALLGIPKADHFGSPDPSCLGLVELPAAEEAGLLWVHPDPAGHIDLDEQLGPDLRAELASWELGELSYLGRDEYEVACNWKLAMDTFGETYHFPSLHAETINLGFHGNVQCYDTYGRNHRMLLCKRDIALLRDLPENEWEVTTAALPVYWLFPNVQLMPFAEGLHLLRAYPDRHDPGRHVSRISWYLRPEPAGDGQARELLSAISQGFGAIIRDEDYMASASQQRTAGSGVVDHLVFGRNEPALHHYHGTYRRMLDLEPLPLLDAL
jgi:nitrite reductase/ring-hydroxylating ferredoxin subunit